MPAVTVTTISTSVQISTPTPKELTEFNVGDCPICWLPTIKIATEEQLHADEQLNISTAKQIETTCMAGDQASSATASQPEATVNPEGQLEATASTENPSSDATATQPEATVTIPGSAKTLCNHIFHVDCLKPWINGWRENAPAPFIPQLPTCPYCRTELPVIIEKNLIYHRGKTFWEILDLIKKCGVKNLLEEFGENTAYYCLESEEAMGLMDKVYVAEVDEEGEEKDDDQKVDDQEKEEPGVEYTEDWWW
jgi:hypothetical protein